MIYGGIYNNVGRKGLNIGRLMGGLSSGSSGSPSGAPVPAHSDLDPVISNMIIADGQAQLDGVSDDIMIANGDHIDATDLAAGCMWNIWVLPDALSALFPIYWMDGEYKIELNASNQFAAYIYDAEGDYLGEILDQAVVNPSLWHNLQVYWDGSTITMRMSVNNSTLFTATTSDNSGVFGTWTAGSNALYMGKENANFAAGAIRGAVIIAEDINLLAYSPITKGVIKTRSAVDNSYPDFLQAYTGFLGGSAAAVSLYASLQADATDDTGLNTLVLE